MGGTNPKTERTSAAARLSPLSWLGVSWNGSQSEAIPETGITNRTSGRANSYSADYTPLSFSRFKLGSRFTLSDNLQSAPSGATQEVTTNTNSFAQNYTINLTLHSAAPLTVGLTIEDYKNRNDHPTSTSRIDTQTQNQTYTGGLTFNFIPKLTLISNYNLKITKVLQDLSLSAQERRKTVFDNKATYQISSWGTLVYNRQDEKNGGEIQAGSIADLNIEKITQTYSLNINFPVENPVLSSFVFLASIKSVDYKNLNSSSDDFVAALTTFEGSLNF